MQSLPPNVLREIYGKSSPWMQARMRVATRDVRELPAPVDGKLKKRVQRALLRAKAVIAVAPWRGWRKKERFLDLFYRATSYARVLEAGNPLNKQDALYRLYDLEDLEDSISEWEITNAQLSRAVAHERRKAKRDKKYNYTPRDGWREGARDDRVARRAQRRAAAAQPATRPATRPAAVSAAAAATLRPGRNAPFDVLRGGGRLALANAARAAARHPAVADFQTRGPTVPR